MDTGFSFVNPKFKACLMNHVNPISKIENIDVVQKILNSCVMDYYVTKTSVSIEGGYPCYQKNFIEKFTIPEYNRLRKLNSIRSLKDPHRNR
jgi:adenine-specific DNA-methyltransferase